MLTDLKKIEGNKKSPEQAMILILLLRIVSWKLRLVIPLWVGAVSTSENWCINRHTARCTSPVSVVWQCILVPGWGKRKRRYLWTEMESSRPWPWPRGASRPAIVGFGIGLGLGLDTSGLDSISAYGPYCSGKTKFFMLRITVFHNCRKYPLL